MNWEGIIATPFGYLMDGLYRLLSNYGLTLIVFAALVQALMVPLHLKNKRDKEKKRRLQPVIAQIREEYKDDIDKQTDVITALYNKEKISLAGNFILSILPIFILVAIFQVIAQPITYLFHETPETAASIVAVMQEEAPELFVSRYPQVTAIAHIQDYVELIAERVPDVAARTLQGLDYTFLGLDLGTVPGTHILGKTSWVWDWAHIGVVLIPLIYIVRRIYITLAGMIRSLSVYRKAKKQAELDGRPAPKKPAPPLLQLITLLMTATILFSIPVAMNLYWLTGSVTASGYQKLVAKWEQKKLAKMRSEVAVETKQNCTD